MPSDFSGDWTLDKHGDVTPDMLDAMQIPAEKRPPFPITKLEVHIKQEGDNFTIKSETAAGSHEYTFEVGSTFETHLVNWLPKMQVAASWDGDKLIFAGEGGFSMVRVIVNGQMVTTLSKGDVSFEVLFNKV